MRSKVVTGKTARPKGRAMQVVGDRWALLIVEQALAGVTRFSHFKQRLGIATNILSSRLDRLEALGILTSTRAKHDSRIRDYILTPKGAGLEMVIDAMYTWESRCGPL